MKKILFLINNFNGGGAEKVLFETLKQLDKAKYDIDVMTIYDEGVYVDEVKKMTNYKFIFKKKKNFCGISFYSIILRIIKILPAKLLYKMFIRDKYDIEIAFLEGPSTKIISGSNNHNSKKFCWVHTDLIKYNSYQKYYLFKTGSKISYTRFDKIFCVSSSVKNSFVKKYNISNNVEVLFNILDEKEVLKKSNEKFNINVKWNEKFNIISIGSLIHAKNYSMLLRVIKRLHSNYDFNLYILGGGILKKELQKYINDNKMDGYVKLLGFISNPYPYLKKSNLYVCSSTVEGFNTAIVEAIILNVPVITTDCGGMRDILGNSEYGMITENNEESLYNGLEKILSDKNLYEYYCNKSKSRSNFFKVEERIKEFENQILD